MLKEITVVRIPFGLGRWQSIISRGTWCPNLTCVGARDGALSPKLHFMPSSATSSATGDLPSFVKQEVIFFTVAKIDEEQYR